MNRISPKGKLTVTNVLILPVDGYDYIYLNITFKDEENNKWSFSTSKHVLDLGSVIEDKSDEVNNKC